MADSKPKKPVSNWQKLQGKLVKTGVTKPKKIEEIVPETVAPDSIKKKKQMERENNLSAISAQSLRTVVKSKYVGLDCEMVGLGLNGKESALARCCCVDFDGNTIYDKFVRPKGFVTDFRTQWSGVRKSDLRLGQAVSFEECQRDVAELLKGKILVGHALKNDLDVLMLSHPRLMIRDTAKYKPYMRVHGRHGKFRPRALKDLTAQYLGVRIQTGEHNPAEDANSAVLLYRHKMEEWEAALKESKLKAKQAVLENNATTAAGAKKDNKKNKTDNSNSSNKANTSDSHLNNIDEVECSATESESEESDSDGKVKDIPEISKPPKKYVYNPATGEVEKKSVKSITKATTNSAKKQDNNENTTAVKRKVATSMFGEVVPSSLNPNQGAKKMKVGGVEVVDGSVVMNKPIRAKSIVDIDKMMEIKKKDTANSKKVQFA